MQKLSSMGLDATWKPHGAAEKYFEERRNLKKLLFGLHMPLYLLDCQSTLRESM